MQGSPRREDWIDVLRVISCFAVVLIHTSGQTYQKYGSIPVAEWWFANLLNGSSRWAVPLFVLISGATLKVSDADASRFYKKKALRFLPVIFAWSALYAAFDLIVLGMRPIEVIGQIVGRGFVYQHLWYLSMYLFMLIFIPFLARIRFSPPDGDSQWRILPVAGFLAISLDWGFEAVSRLLKIEFVPWPRTFVEFIPYLLFGLLFSDRRNGLPLRRPGMWLLAVLAVSLGANWLAVSRLDVVDDSMPLANRSTLVAAAAVGVFLFVRERVWGSRVSTLMRAVAPACLGIYLVHPLFLWLIQRVFRGTGIEVLRGAWMPATALILFLISYVTVLLIRKMPLGNRIC
ncbi:MAG: acyltransferase family protein [Verrucomicrobiota bacterium]